jgi:SAM-dependent methyltransferase
MDKINEKKDEEKIKMIKFDQEPSYAKLWDACVYNLLYKKDEHIQEIESLFSRLEINKNSRILDSSAGGGFPAIHLRADGYDVDCMDLMQDEIDVFQEKAKENNVSGEINKIAWKEIPENYEKENFNFILCRGNSFIYADGGWNESQQVEKQKSLSSYGETLRIFYDALKPGGYLYIDKFMDDEIPHKDVVAKIIVEGKEEDLIFFTEKMPEKGMRRAMMIRKDSEGVESGVPNMTYNLSNDELEEMMKRVGFKVEKLDMKTESHFTVWLARKK